MICFGLCILQTQSSAWYVLTYVGTCYATAARSSQTYLSKIFCSCNLRIPRVIVASHSVFQSLDDQSSRRLGCNALYAVFIFFLFSFIILLAFWESIRRPRDVLSRARPNSSRPFRPFESFLINRPPRYGHTSHTRTVIITFCTLPKHIIHCSVCPYLTYVLISFGQKSTAGLLLKAMAINKMRIMCNTFAMRPVLFSFSSCCDGSTETY